MSNSVTKILRDLPGTRRSVAPRGMPVSKATPTSNARGVASNARLAANAQPLLPTRVRDFHPQLTYGGGPLLRNAHVVAIYPGSYWHTKTGRADRRYFDGFKHALVANQGYSRVLSQYGVGRATAGRSVNAAGHLPRVVHQSDVTAIVNAQILSGRAPTGPNNLYTVVLPPGKRLVTSNGTPVGGYHYQDQGPNGQTINIAVVAYSGGAGKPGTRAARDATTTAISHEYAEHLTDPIPGQGWYDSKTKYRDWNDRAQVGAGEIGDIANAIAELGSGQVYGEARSGRYEFSKLWSNRDNRAEIATSHPGPPASIAAQVFAGRTAKISG